MTAVWHRLGNLIGRSMQYLLIKAVQLYRLLISPWFPPTCRFHPSCSHYAITAIQIHGPLSGSWLAVKRLLRCHPWGGHGYDPVPPKKTDSD